MAALKVGTDAVLLGAAMTLIPSDRLMLDIGTGTGVIALMAAQRHPEAHITAIDIDGPSAREAAINFGASPWTDRLESIHAPLSGFNAAEPFDLIFSNPPYYDNSLTNPNARESAARHTGSLSFREICAYASEHLTPCGRLSLILPSDAERALVRTAASFGLHPFRILRVRTTAEKAPARIVCEFSRTHTAPSEEELILQNGNARTAAYSELTREFYLQG